MVSEHAIAGYKRFKATSDTYRNKLPNMDDTMNGVCAALNYETPIFVIPDGFLADLGSNTYR